MGESSGTARAYLYGLSSGARLAVRQLAEWTYPEYSMGATFSLPVFNRTARADDLRAPLETQQAEPALQRMRSSLLIRPSGR